MRFPYHAACRCAILWIVITSGRMTTAPANGAIPPDGFTVSTYVSGLAEPVAIAPAPDGRLFVAERGGTIRIVAPGTTNEAGVLVSDPFAAFEVFTNGECGLLGMALDPSFEANGYVYVFLTASAVEQRIVRVTDAGGAAAQETLIRGNLPTQGGVHNGGGLRVGPDGKLYFSIGDNGDASASDSLTTLAGKIGRIHLDGSIPDDNPFLTPTGTPRAVFASGFRNPFRFCFASDGRLFVMDVGSDGDGRYEEINLVQAGRHYGWPEVEGPGQGGDAVDPIFAYQEQGAAITGCAVYEADRFPAEYHGSLFHLDYTAGRLFRAMLDGDRLIEHVIFAETGGGPVDLAVGIDGSLLFTRIFSGDIQRVSFAGEGGGTVPSPFDGGLGDEGSAAGTRRLCGAGGLAVMGLGAWMSWLASRRRLHRTFRS